MTNQNNRTMIRLGWYGLFVIVILYSYFKVFPLNMTPKYPFVYAIIKGIGNYICIQSQADSYFYKRCFDTETDGRICYTINYYVYDFANKMSRPISEKELKNYVLFQIPLDGFSIKLAHSGTYTNYVTDIYLKKYGRSERLNISIGSEYNCFLFLGWMKSIR